jgi:hypothetical protein
MKKIILLLAAMFLVACGTSKKEVIEDPIFPQNKIIFYQQGKVGYLMQDPIFPQNYIQYGEHGKEAYIVADPLFEGSHLIFPEPE